jgi:ATP-dependent Clp protease ATP-binding subunit ClpC
VDFKNAIVVMTSNVGAKNITERKRLGFTAHNQETMDITEIRQTVMNDLKQAFRPEFLNRVDEIIVFHQLSREDIRLVATGMLKLVGERVSSLGIQLSIEESALDLLVDKGFDPIYGARPLRRAIQSSIEDAAAERVLDGRVKPGQTLKVTAVDGEFVFDSVSAEGAEAQEVERELETV